MPEELADHGKALGYQKTAAGETVSQIVDAHVVKLVTSTFYFFAGTACL